MNEVETYEEMLESARKALICIVCHEKLAEDCRNGAWACKDCRKKYPPALLKAAGDTFDYAVRLVTGEIVYFQRASIAGDFVTLHDVGRENDPFGKASTLPYLFARGLDVRIDAIVWCADLGH